MQLYLYVVGLSLYVSLVAIKCFTFFSAPHSKMTFTSQKLHNRYFYKYIGVRSQYPIELLNRALNYTLM